MPYRIDISDPPPDALDRLVEWGALDIESVSGGLAAILPDGVTAEVVAGALGATRVTVSAAAARDNGSVWMVSPRAVRIGSVVIAPAHAGARADAVQLTDATAFGTGHHPTTALCIEILEEILTGERIDSMLDVGTGSGILALAALRLGVRHAVGVDLDGAAVETAAANARLNHVTDRLQLVRGGPDAVDGNWPLVVANVLAAPLMEMAPALTRRVGRRGRLILSGIRQSLEGEVRQAYQHVGMRCVGSKTRAGWIALVEQASW